MAEPQRETWMREGREMQDDPATSAHTPRDDGFTVVAADNPTVAAADNAHLSADEIREMDLAPDEVPEEEQLEEEVPQQVAIGKRFGDWRTLLSFGIAVAILVFAITKASINWSLALQKLQ